MWSSIVLQPLPVSGDSVYLNVGEINTSIWTGVLKRRSLLSGLEPAALIVFAR